MNNEEKILQMLTEMRSEMDARFSKLEATQAKQGEQLAKQGEQLAKQGEQLNRLEADISGLKADVKTLDARSLKSAVLLETEVPRDINRLYEANSEIAEKLKALATKEQVDELAAGVAVIKDVVSRHSGDISQLKKAL